MRPDELLDLNLDSENTGSNSLNTFSASAVTVNNVTLPNGEYYHMCMQLNERQQHLFNYVMQWAAKYYIAERNDVPEPDPYYILLTSGVGVGKRFLLNVLTKYLNMLLWYPGQNKGEQPSVCVTNLLEKQLVINGFTIHSALNLPNDKFNTCRIATQVP